MPVLRLSKCASVLLCLMSWQTGMALAQPGVFLPTDLDADGVANIDDRDDDNDGVPDTLEGFVDDNADGQPDNAAVDSDSDGIVDSRDLDSDNDSIYDVNERGGFAVHVPDGRLDGPVDEQGLAAQSTDSVSDTDGDGVADLRDLDSDNDGLPDVLEARGSDPNGDGRLDAIRDENGDGAEDALASAASAWIDTDGDTIPDHLDLDSDNDGIPDLFEAHGGSLDIDNDGRLDDVTDLDADGLLDALLGQMTLLIDTDQDGLPDSVDLDSDDDGLSDLEESGGVDADGDGRVDALADTDGDGIPDAVDVDVTGGTDSDGDDIDDLADVDSTALADSDGDGIIDTADPDSNGDGFVGPSDSGQGSPIQVPDDDSDGVPDFQQHSGRVKSGLDGSGLGCSLVAGGSDPMLLWLLAAASALLVWRRRLRG